MKPYSSTDSSATSPRSPPGESDEWLLDAPSAWDWLEVEKAVLRFLAD